MSGRIDSNAKRDSTVTVRDSILQKYKQEKKERVQKGKPLKYYQIPSPIHKQFMGKRAFDLIIGSLAFLIFMIVYPFIALGIKLSSPGEVIFMQKRTGYNGHAFTCYKFRTMHKVQSKNEEDKPTVTKKGDSRIFKFGSFLRISNLDELPQIINVIKGEMSLIGPRPYPVDECRHWNNTFEDFYYRYMVKPGVTGYAQVSGYRGGTLDEAHMRKRLDKDLIYVEKQSLWMDIKILYWTVKQMVLFKTNAH